ncbi:protein FAR1-RELATED SEQUENCE 5-like [Silene latifolia]|uniref:protein FAR1-RELATED SEQUENCE 5-like n=1 Tax=Silene latifolia TaxID=37657 RepID=UPI003D7722F5
MNGNDFNNDFNNEDSNEVINDGDGVDYSDHFTPTRFFASSTEAFNWAYEIGLRLGFGIKKSSNKKVGRNTNLRQRYFVCRMGGKGPVNKDADSLMRGNTATAWCNCKFSMKVVELEENKWQLVMRSGFHNHGLTLYCDGDRYFAKFDDEELAFIDAQVRAHVRPAIISAGLHQRNPEKSRPNRRQIYNRSQKVRVEERDGRNPAQQMLALAVQHKYVHYWVTDQETDELTHVFMAHPEAVKMFRSYYYVVQIDSTYKTNDYRLPLVEMVGVTPVGKSFVIAYALVTHESEEKYLWVLRKLKALLNDVVQPNAIVTDCEKGLLNAIPIVFPDSSHLLCLWHIYSNVETKALDITGQDNWAKHVTFNLFTAVVEAETEDKFNVAWGKLAREWAGVAAYIERQWFPHLEKWAKYRTNNITHFGNTSTSRVESAHANLKRWLNSAKLAVDSIWSRFHSLMETQHVEIRHSLELSRSRRLTGIQRLFSRLSCKISKNAIIELRKEFERGAKMTEDALTIDCGCVKATTLGLLCACSLHRISRNGSRVPVDVLHAFWRKLEYDGSEAMPTCDDDRLEELFDEIRNADDEDDDSSSSS